MSPSVLASSGVYRFSAAPAAALMRSASLSGWETRQLGKHFKRLLGVLLRPVDVNVLHFYHAHAVVPRFFSIAPAPRRGEGDGRGVRLPRYGQYFKKALICSGERP